MQEVTVDKAVRERPHRMLCSLKLDGRDRTRPTRLRKNLEIRSVSFIMALRITGASDVKHQARGACQDVTPVRDLLKREHSMRMALRSAEALCSPSRCTLLVHALHAVAYCEKTCPDELDEVPWSLLMSSCLCRCHRNFGCSQHKCEQDSPSHRRKQVTHGAAHADIKPARTSDRSVGPFDKGRLQAEHFTQLLKRM